MSVKYMNAGCKCDCSGYYSIHIISHSKAVASVMGSKAGTCNRVVFMNMSMLNGYFLVGGWVGGNNSVPEHHGHKYIQHPHNSYLPYFLLS